MADFQRLEELVNAAMERLRTEQAERAAAAKATAAATAAEATAAVTAATAAPLVSQPLASTAPLDADVAMPAA